MRTYALLRQAERSLAHGIHDDWGSVIDYYSGERLACVESQTEELMRILPFSEPRREVLGREVLPKHLVFHRLWRRVGRIFTMRGDGYYFKQAETELLASCLEGLKILLTTDSPPRERIASLRRECYYGQLVLRLACGSLPELKKADSIENFGMPRFIQHFTLHDVLGS